MKIKLVVLLTLVMVLCLSGAVNAQVKTVPNVIAYQATLFDDGGNPIPDGPVGVLFRIVDAAGTSIYEERQTLDVIGGQVSALVGNGLDANGAPLGGMPATLLDPSAPRYLEAQIDGMPAGTPAEIASVPYSLYAGQALAAAEGAIDSRAIADGGVAYDDLSAELIGRLSQELIGRDPGTAARIGVRPEFVYSASNDLQGALTDLDRAIKRRDERIDAEAAARGAADAAEAAARGAADAAHAAAAISAAHPNGALPISRLDSDVATQTELDQEIVARQVQDNAVLAQLAVVADENKASAERGTEQLRSDMDARLYPSAWGTVTIGYEGDNRTVDYHGSNVVKIDVAKDYGDDSDWCRISFEHNMVNANYAAIIVSMTTTAFVNNKTVDGFTVHSGGGVSPPTKRGFDFIVIGP